MLHQALSDLLLIGTEKVEKSMLMIQCERHVQLLILQLAKTGIHSLHAIQ